MDPVAAGAAQGAAATAAPGAADPAAAPAAPPAPGVAAPAAPPADPNAVKLKAFQTPDGLAKGKVPDEDGWVTGGVNGALECFNANRGELHLGLLGIVCMPGGMTAMMAQMYGWVVAPYLRAQEAVTHVWPQFRNAIEPGVGFGWVQIESANPMNWGADSDTGLFKYRFRRGSVQWHGQILASTTPLLNDDRWILYYSQMAVPDSDDGSMYEALAECWKAYDASKAASPANTTTAQAVKESGQRSAAAMQAQRETAALLDASLLARQASSEKHNAAVLQQLKQ
jgi:hypothetical protein